MTAGGRNHCGNPLRQGLLSGSHSCSHLPLSLSLPSSHPLPFPTSTLPTVQSLPKERRCLLGDPDASPHTHSTCLYTEPAKTASQRLTIEGSVA